MPSTAASTASTPAPVAQFVNTNGRSPRARRESCVGGATHMLGFFRVENTVSKPRGGVAAGRGRGGCPFVRRGLADADRPADADTRNALRIQAWREWIDVVMVVSMLFQRYLLS